MVAKKRVSITRYLNKMDQCSAQKDSVVHSTAQLELIEIYESKITHWVGIKLPITLIDDAIFNQIIYSKQNFASKADIQFCRGIVNKYGEVTYFKKL